MKTTFDRMEADGWKLGGARGKLGEILGDGERWSGICFRQQNRRGRAFALATVA